MVLVVVCLPVVTTVPCFAQTFEPTMRPSSCPSSYAFDIGSAGSTALVLQTIFPVLLFAGRSTDVSVVGGTHNPMAPPFEFLRECFCPAVARAGISLTIELLRHGFYPAGGGRLHAVTQPLEHPVPLRLVERGELRSRLAVSKTGGLPQDLSRRQVEALRKGLEWKRDRETPEGAAIHHERITELAGSGNVVYAVLAFDNVTEVVTSVGDRGKSANAVVQEVVDGVHSYSRLGHSAPVDEYLADQLLL